ncbi:MAG: GtrA family protein [Thermoproteota archaeon]|nr:GtrA family protein [Thermoproteota archaeon]
MKSLLIQSIKFFIVGFTGLFVNYFTSIFFFGFLKSEFIYSTATGIIVSIFSNFILNKIWTFKDLDFSLKHLLKQILFFVIISSLGILIQLSLVYFLVEKGFSYSVSLIFSILVAALGNFILNKKITFDRKL